MWKINKVNEDYLQHRRIRLARHKKRRFLKKKREDAEKLRKRLVAKKLKTIRIWNTWKTKKIEPPANFSLINNTNEVIKYFDINQKFLYRWYEADFDLSNVEWLTFDSIALLMTKIKDPDYMQGSTARWKAPNKEELSHLFEVSNFYKYVRREIKEGQISTWDMFHHVSLDKVNREIWSKLTDLITEKKKNYQWLYPVLIECMMNTSEHAWIGRNKVYNWWVIYDIDRNSKIARICFIDLGIWIFWSLNDWRMQALDKIWIVRNFNKLEWILKETVEMPSRTNLWERWTWLPQIYRFSKRNEVVKSVIITNNAYWDLINDNYFELEENFWWTFFYWEIDINKI